MFHLLTKPLLLIIFLFLISAFALTQTREWFFFKTGQARIDFISARGETDPSSKIAYFEGKTINVPDIPQNTKLATNVLGESAGSEKRIEVDLTSQKLYAFEGNNKIFDFVISSGRTITPTPTGEFTTWIKLRSTRMKGGSKALGTYYDLPNVPFVMFFQNAQVPGWKGYGIHGTYWHNNFGTPMSHGCINMKTPEAEQLYTWANPPLSGNSVIKVTNENPGTKVIIYGTTPRS